MSKIMIDPGQIAGAYVEVDDWFEVPTAGGTQVMKVIEPRTYRGEKPGVFHHHREAAVMARRTQFRIPGARTWVEKHQKHRQRGSCTSNSHGSKNNRTLLVW